jgi:hypothetical protein
MDKTLTKEEFVEEYSTYGGNHPTAIASRGKMLSDLNALLRAELLSFCRKKLSPDIIGDEVIFIDEYIKSQQQ